MSGVTPLWRWRAFLIWISIIGFLGLFGQLAPLLHTLGYEYAFVIALVSSLGSGHLAALYPARVRDQLAWFPGARFPALVLYVRVLAMGLLLLVPPLALSLLNGLRIPICNLHEGLAFYLLIPLPAVAIAAATGMVSGLVTGGPRLATALWFLIYFAFIALALHSLYATPAVYAFGPFFGYYPGVLYDEIIRIEDRLLTYRVATVVQTAALVGLAHTFLDPSTLRLALLAGRKRTVRATATIALTLVALAMCSAGSGLGHRVTRADLERLLSQTVKSPKLTLHFPAGAAASEIDDLTRDAEFSLHQVERYLDSASGPPITVFFFSTVADKEAAMGAANTNVAKPWRSEVYVVMDQPPHAVLRHELAHAVAARFGSRPFGVAADMGGLLPNPGFIEGIAVAAQGPRGDLTIHQWAAAMSKLRLLPSLDSLFGFGFFNRQTNAAYTAAGSFVSWARKELGAKTIQEAYRTNDWEHATNSSLNELENQWRKYLGTVALQPADLDSAKHKFDRPALIRARCVHEVARLTEKAARLSAAGEHEKAIEVLSRAYARSGGSTAARLRVFYSVVQSGNTLKTRSMAADLLSERAIGAVERSRIREILADLDLAEENDPDVGKRYADLAFRADDEANRRRLQVKTHLAGLSDKHIAARLSGILAVQPVESAVSAPLAALIISKAAAKIPDDPVISYLLARQFFIHGGYQDALEYFQRAERQGLHETTASIWLEARMMRGRALYQLGKLNSAQIAFANIAQDEAARPSRREQAEDWKERCAFESTRKKKADSLGTGK